MSKTSKKKAKQIAEKPLEQSAFGTTEQSGFDSSEQNSPNSAEQSSANSRKAGAGQAEEMPKSTAGRRFSRLYIVTAVSTGAVCLAIVLITAQVSRSAARRIEKNPVILPSPAPVDSLLEGFSADGVLSAKTAAPIPTAAPKTSESAAQASPIPADSESNAAQAASAKQTDTADANQESVAVGLFKKSEPFSIRMPLAGEVLHPFSADRLQKSKTLGDWRTHNGVDLKAESGTPVCAAADGVVLRAEYDAMTGCTVVLQHDGQYQTVYANLASAEMVEKGQSVRAGECLGAVGDSAVFEKLEESHLHFELTENGVFKNPLDYIK